MINKKKVLDAVMVLENFLNSVPGGESYWIDDKGKEHHTNIGYVNEFLMDLKEYVRSVGEEQPEIKEHNSNNYKVYVSYKFIPVSGEFYCSDYSINYCTDKNHKNKIVFLFKAMEKENKVDLTALNMIKITSERTGAVLYQYPPNRCPCNC